MVASRLIAVMLAGCSLAGARTAYAQSTRLAITDVTVIDGTGGPARPHMTVLVEGGRIVAIEAATHGAPRDATDIDGSGKFLIPGLWDMLVHVTKAGDKALGLFIANGVTSVRDVGGDFTVIRAWRSEIDSGVRVGPRIRTSGPTLESAERVRRLKARGTVEPADRLRAPVADTSDARRVVDSVAKLGVDFVKMRTAASPEVYRAVAAETRRVGLTLAAHGDIVGPQAMLDAGQRSIEHAIYPPLQELGAAERTRIVRQLADARVAIVPTMDVYYRWLLVPAGDARRIVDDSLGQIDPRRRYISGYLLADWREQVGQRGGFRDALVRHVVLSRVAGGGLRDLQEMHRGGVRILPGTDVGVALIYPGFSLHDELHYFVDKIGMTPSEVLRSATHDAAEFSGMLDSLGTVTVGKGADLVLLDADPLADIRNVDRISAVVVRGRVFDRARIAQLLAAAETR